MGDFVSGEKMVLSWTQPLWFGKWVLRYQGMSPAPLLLLLLDVWVWRYGCMP